MGYKFNIFSETTSGEPEEEWPVETPDLESQIILRQLARARGLDTHVQDGAKNLVTVRGRESEVRELVNDGEALALRFYIRHLELLGEFLEEHGLEPPPPLPKTLAMLEAAADALWGEG